LNASKVQRAPLENDHWRTTMASFYELFLSFAARAPAAWDRLTQRAKPKDRPLGGDIPAIFHANRHLRRDIGLAPVDERGWPL
jgi:hypothetical protein